MCFLGISSLGFSCLFSCHWAPQSQVLSIFFTPSHQVFIYINEMRVSLPWAEQSLCSASLYTRDAPVLHHLYGPLLASCCKLPSLSCWGPQNWTQHCNCVSPGLCREEGSLPLAGCQPLPRHGILAQDAAGRLCGESVYLPHS